MSEEKQGLEVWQNSPTTRTYVHDDADLIDTPGKSSSPITYKITDQVDKADDAWLEFSRSRQKQVEDDISFQLWKLELERQLAKAKIDTEVARLEHVQNANRNWSRWECKNK